ncbi:MAG TPA: MBL fold metallo-hydrolase [Methylomirabilota bacterium]|jgi:N-acyl-phosphatidylethanolamine-hydrolysing phospholipase D|nr:MBL fold metallo-hydrolase [Methylomirabilota bacterium]
MRRHQILSVALVVAVAALSFALPSLQAQPRVVLDGKSHHLAQGFHNLDPGYSYSMVSRAGRLVRRSFEGWPERGTPPVRVANDGVELRANGQTPTVTWIGHATVLVQMNGVNILTDPIWSQRASPLAFAGPRRLVEPGLRFEDLPRIHAVVISHDHYDHLDLATVHRLAREHRPTFFVPLGLKAWLGHQGVTDVVEMDWWDAKEFKGLTFVCTPSQHSSGRTFSDQHLRLWSSWVVTSPNRRFFFAGDTGYAASMKEIGRRYGPFDLAAIPIGGYSAYEGRHPNHVNPEEALQLFEDLRARVMVPVHWGTFDMNREPFREPPDRLLKEAVRRGIEEQIAMLTQGQSIHW